MRRTEGIECDNCDTAPRHFVGERSAVRAKADNRYIGCVHHAGRLTSGRRNGQ
jgi:hypothetical protein